MKSLAAQGDVDGLLQSEIARLDSGRKLPEGWSNLYRFGGGPAIFSRGEKGEILCRAHQKAVGILQRPARVALQPGVRLGWKWRIDELPSLAPEDRAATHDYLSIGAEFDDGQDLTYFWSQGLPQGTVFRCPPPRWNGIETHLAIRSGREGVGQWSGEERDVHAVYAAYIGGSAKEIVRL